MAAELLSHLNAETFDLAKMAAFIAAILINRQAVFIVITQVIAVFMFKEMKQSPVIYYCTSSALFALAATLNVRRVCTVLPLSLTINITLSYSIRQALFCMACINWLAALDFSFTDGVTAFYLCYPWLVNGLDVFILYCLLRKGGRSIVGISDPFNSRAVHL
jgi:hypothetical protein